MSFSVFLPCRKGSERVPNKNTKPFAGVKGGLLEIKLNQLLKLKSVDSIVVSSNDEIVLNFASKYEDSRLLIDERPDYLGQSSTSTDDLIAYVPKIITSGHVLWTHVTSPFIDSNGYETIIGKYKSALRDGYDSLMTVKEVRGFIWDKEQALNYNRAKEKWPRTQTIAPLYEIDSAVFLASIDKYLQEADRIGTKPFLFVQNAKNAIDIDWPEDFDYAESVWSQRVK